jgi:hypothetical protein
MHDFGRRFLPQCPRPCLTFCGRLAANLSYNRYQECYRWFDPSLGSHFEETVCAIRGKAPARDSRSIRGPKPLRFSVGPRERTVEGKPIA